MKSLPAKIFLFIPLCLLSIILCAQPDLSRIESGANTTSFIYQGELTPSKPGSYKTIGLSLDIYGAYKLNNNFYLKTNVAFGKLTGDDSKYQTPTWRRQRKFKFKSSVRQII